MLLAMVIVFDIVVIVCTLYTIKANRDLQREINVVQDIDDQMSLLRLVLVCPWCHALDSPVKTYWQHDPTTRSSYMDVSRSDSDHDCPGPFASLV